jgi:alpha-beta hydrolase superfamily lysophospholipase
MRLAPELAVPNGLDVSKLSHDPAVVEAYRKDRRVHNRISARLASFILLNGRRVLEAAPRWRLPTLLLYSGADHLVDPAGSRAFAERAPGQIVMAQCHDDLYHELFNEQDPSAVFGTLRAWLDLHVTPR